MQAQHSNHQEGEPMGVNLNDLTLSEHQEK